MKSLKLHKVKISRIGNSHVLFGGATNGCPTTSGPPVTMDVECLRSRDPHDTDCATVTNTTGGQRTSGAFSGETDDGE